MMLNACHFKLSIFLSLATVLLFLERVTSLNCWHCISENCNEEPGDIYQAVERMCLPGQFCQKVYFKMYSTTDKKTYSSTVRGCAWDCAPKDDFLNCTSDMYSSRGCIEKSCCRDKDLCNSSNTGRLDGVLFLLFNAMTSLTFL